MTPHDDQKLERLIHQTLRDLPPRRAPRGLEARVLAEIERRAALPWWRHSVAHWPIPARAACMVLLLAVAALVVMLGGWVTGGVELTNLRAELALHFPMLRALAGLGRTLADVGAMLVHSLPTLWLYGAAAIVGVLYLAFFGIGTLAYRTLFTNR